MTKEELEQEANEYVSKYQGWGWTPHKGSSTFIAMIYSYLAGAEPREKRIAVLESQIEKMKSDYEQLLDEKIELEDRLTESRECY